MRWLLIASFFFLLASCEKESFINSPDARLFISADTIRFDTVFTSVGSTTSAFKIRNDNDQKLLISSISVAGGNQSPFTINVNGIASQSVTDIEISKGDSIYVFIRVNINPYNDSLPFLVRDSILIAFNGNRRFVQLEAFGQNAHFIRNGIIASNQTWNNDLPYVILGTLKVDSSAELNIEAGCRIYLHADAGLDVYGRIKVNGEAGQRVLFTGDRLDGYYRDLPGSWPGIFIRESSDGNVIRFAVIKNAYQALVSRGKPLSASKLLLSRTIIDNAYEAGIIGLNSNIQSENCLISNCGRNLVIIEGGNYTFRHNTISSFNTLYLSHRFPVAYLTDEGNETGVSVTRPLQMNFINCILWGETGIVPNELQVVKKGNAFSVTLDHCILKTEDDPANTTLTSVIRNQDPLFDSIDAGNNYFDFHTRNLSGAPGINSGIPTDLLIDLDGLDRNIAAPDLGCYEKQ